MTLNPSGLETHPDASSNPNAIINSNWQVLNDLHGSYPLAPRGLTGLVGGTATDLDKIDVSALLSDTFIFTNLNDNSGAGTGKRFRVYLFRDMVGTETEDAPSLIVSDEDSTKVFEQLS